MEEEQQLNKKFLAISLIASIVLSILVILIAIKLNQPIFFAGLFLPFFFVKKRTK